MRNYLNTLLIVTVYCKLNLESLSCQIYLNKFDDIVFDHSVNYQQDQQNIIFTFGYFDPLYSNQTFYGLTKEDGKSIESVCLDVKIFLFGSLFYNDLITIENQILSSSTNETTKYRYLSLNIKENEIEKLVSQINDFMYSFSCYYAIVYYLSEDVYFFHKSNFTLYFFHQFNMYQDFFEIRLPVQGEIQFCNDSICSESSIPEIYFNDQFYIQQSILLPIIPEYYLINTTVYLTGGGFYKQEKIIGINNSIIGKTTILLEADIVWSSLFIQVESVIFIDWTGALRLLEENKTIDEDQQIYSIYESQLRQSNRINSQKQVLNMINGKVNDVI